MGNFHSAFKKVYLCSLFTYIHCFRGATILYRADPKLSAALLWIFKVLLYQKVFSKIRLLSYSSVTSKPSRSLDFSAEQNRIVSLPRWCAMQKMYLGQWSTHYIDEHHRKPCRKWNNLSSQEVCTKKFLGPHTEKVLFRQYFPALALDEVALQSPEIIFLEIDFDIAKFVHRLGWLKFSTRILILSFLKCQVLEFCVPNVLLTSFQVPRNC